MQEVGAEAGHGGARRGAAVQGNDITLKILVAPTPPTPLRRLKRDRPDLAERLVAGEMSANAAAIAAAISGMRTLSFDGGCDGAAALAYSGQCSPHCRRFSRFSSRPKTAGRSGLFA
jgi:hypothetical protein